VSRNVFAAIHDFKKLIERQSADYCSSGYRRPARFRVDNPNIA
jgi:hypothetical protein